MLIIFLITVKKIAKNQVKNIVKNIENNRGNTMEYKAKKFFQLTFNEKKSKSK